MFLRASSSEDDFSFFSASPQVWFFFFSWDRNTEGFVFLSKNGISLNVFFHCAAVTLSPSLPLLLPSFSGHFPLFSTSLLCTISPSLVPSPSSFLSLLYLALAPPLLPRGNDWVYGWVEKRGGSCPPKFYFRETRAQRSMSAFTRPTPACFYSLAHATPR